jgi:Glycosyltransferase family 87
VDGGPVGSPRSDQVRGSAGHPVDHRGRARVQAGTFGRALIRVLPAWLAARVLVALSLILAHLLVNVVRPDNPAARLRVHQGLLAWDGGWYEEIAGHGYATAGTQSVRFFPGFPMVARALAWIPGVGVGTALILLANLLALAAMAALLVLVRHDFGDPGLARRTVWLLALAPSAYALVLGYADAALLLCAVVTVLAARTGRWWWAAMAGLAAGLVRPVGLLLVVPLVIEVWQARRARATALGWTARLAAVVAPLAGTAIYLAWVGHQFGDAWLPFRVQQQNGHRGTFTVPLRAMGHDVESLFHGHHVGSALHVPWVVLSLVLLVVAFRRLPLSYAAFAAVVLAVSVTSSNLDSFERYALGAFPLVIAASTLTSRWSVEVVVLVVAGVGMVGYALLAFLGVVVP